MLEIITILGDLMADSKEQKPSIFSKMLEAGTALLDAQIVKAKSTVMNQNLEDEFFYAKAVTEDPTYSVSAAGWKEKPGRLMDGHLRQMSIANSVAAAIIQTRQNEVANHSKLVTSEKECGWMMDLRDKEALLEKMKEEILAEQEQQLAMKQVSADTVTLAGEDDPEADMAAVVGDDEAKAIQKALRKADGDDVDPMVAQDEQSQTADPNASQKSDDEVEEFNFELERKAKERLEQKFKDAKKKAQDFILNCGLTENRPFETKRWNFDSALRAIVRDSLTYDRYAIEIVPDRAKRVHHWFPVDGATIKYSSNNFKNYKQISENFMNLDILYPEQQVQAMEKQKVLELNDKLLETNAYKYVQIVRGKIERAYTEDELKLGIRNTTTDIYANGYGVSELELAAGLITGHINAEYYNQAYFTQGFSAKGILHIKAAINRRKLETVRQQWQHMLKGARNSFQTPIFAGMEDVAWIPLTQNHQDIGFEGWMRYLIKMICAIYQIDPQEIGIGFKEEGGSSGGMSGDNTREKLEHSKNKGLYPLLRHIENFINENILKSFDNRFVMRFTGITAESREASVKRQDIERKFKKTLNEVREEDGLPPLPGGDEIILGPEFMQWYAQFSPKALEQQKQEQDAMALAAGGGDGEADPFGMDDMSDDNMMGGDNLESSMISLEPADEPADKPADKPGVKKSLARKKLEALVKSRRRTRRVKIEYYKLGK